MRTANQLREEIQGLRDEMESIVGVSETENRDLTEDESKRISQITDTELPARNKQLVSAVKIEQERMKRVADRFENEIEKIGATDGLRTDIRNAGIKIPARAKVHAELKAFTGPDAQRDAYISGMAILAGIFQSEPAQRFCHDHGIAIQNTMTTTDNTKGGFVVPEEMQAAIIRLREARGVFPRFANRVPMGSDIIRVPRLLEDVTAYWVGEGAEITASDATLGGAELMARKLAALVKISSELDEDAVIDIGDMITTSMAYAMADKIDNAGFNGDGTSTYGGIVGLKNALVDADPSDGGDGAIVVAAAGNDSALTLDMADFEKLLGAYPQYEGADPRWFVHSAVFWASMARLADAAGGNTNANIAEGPSQMRFLGYPVTFTQVLPSTTGTAASTIIAYFGDLRLGCAYGVRRSIRTQVSLDRYFENDLIGIKTTERIGINCHEDGASIRTRPILALETAS